MDTIKIEILWNKLQGSNLVMYACMLYMNNESERESEDIQTQENNLYENTSATHSCFHTLFSCVWISLWNTSSSFSYSISIERDSDWLLKMHFIIFTPMGLCLRGCGKFIEKFYMLPVVEDERRKRKGISLAEECCWGRWSNQ